MTLAATLQRAWLRRGFLACALWPLSCLMWAMVRVRRLAYAKSWMATARLPVPVLVVGNRIVGGAGKTPATIAILRHLQARGMKPGVLTRGYGVAIEPESPRLLDSHTAHALNAIETGDEPWLIWRRTGVPVMVGPKRVLSGKMLLRAHPEIDILVCDDGLQHLALQRDIEVVVFDERGAGNGWLLPAGPLREPLHTEPGPGVTTSPLVLYNAAKPSTPLPGHTGRRELGKLVALADWWDGTANAPPPSPDCTDGAWAVAGIAHPSRFFDALRAQGWQLHTLALPDHANFAEWPWPADVRDVIVTEKDAVKLSPLQLQRERPHTRVWVSVLDLCPEHAFWAALDAALDTARNAASSLLSPHSPKPWTPD